MNRLIKKSLFFFVVLMILNSCVVVTTVWDSIKDRYKPYEFLGVDGDKVLVKFVFDSPSASNVWLAGSFNGWAASESSPKYPSVGLDSNPVIEMERDAETGFWTISVALKPGRYQYKYVLDSGRVWSEDMNTDTVDDGFGGKNSVIVVVAPND